MFATERRPLAAAKQPAPGRAPRQRDNAPAGVPFLQRKVCPCGGGCPTCADKDALSLDAVQAKLEVDTPGDPYEQEADRMADLVVSTPANGPAAAPPGPVMAVQRFVQRQAAPSARHEGDGEGDGPAAAPIEQRIAAREHHGSPMTQASREFMESRFHVDFGDVRIHTDADSHALNRDLHANAFTFNRHVFFAQDQYQPGTREGDRLLAHELTHVIQQAGPSGHAQRRRVQRSGPSEHAQIQQRLALANGDLMYEVPIPGALSPDNQSRPGFDADNLSKRGFADLYRSTGNLVSGIRAMPTDETNKEAIGDPPHRYVNIGEGKIGGAHPVYSPKIQSRRPYVLASNPRFPDQFEIGEIKPHYSGFFHPSLATGRLQPDAYIQGFQAFANQVVRKDFPHRSIGGGPSGSEMAVKSGSASPGGFNVLTVPDAIDLTKRQSQLGKAAPAGAILRRDEKLGRYERLWVVADPAEKGVLRYTSLPDDTRPANYGKDLKAQYEQEQALVKGLQAPLEKWPNKPALKRKPGPVPARTLRIQRDAADTVPGDLTGTWRDQWKAWEDKRAAWSGTDKTPGTASEFLKHETDGRKEEIEVLDHFKIPYEAIPHEKSALGGVSFWAGKWGRRLGMLRFRFGGLFDRVAALFKRIGAKFKSFQDGAKADVGGGGWEKQAVEVIGKSLVILLKEFVSQAFTVAVDCVYGVASKVIDYYTREVTEKIEEILEPIRQKFEQVKQELEEKFEPLISAVAKVLSALDKAREIASMLSDIEYGLRLLIEAISCATPPALGCLWGLVAQVGFSLAAAKAIATDLFKTRIAEPAARKLLDATGIGNRIRNFISSIIVKIGFGDLLAGVQACAPVGPIGGSRLSRDVKFSNSDPEVVRARNELAKENAPHAMVEDLQQTLQGDDKQPATRQDIDALVKKMQTSGLPPSQFRKLLTPDKTGKVNVTDATAKIPDPPPPQGAGGSGKGAGKPGSTAESTAAMLKILDAARWDLVPKGSYHVDFSHSPPLFLLRFKTGHRIGAQVKLEEHVVKGVRTYTVVESGEIIALDNLGDDDFLSWKDGANGTTFVLMHGSTRGTVVDDGPAFNGLGSQR